MSAAGAYRSFSPRRIGAMVLRYRYLLRYSWPRIVDLVYWPAVQMLMWGFLQTYLATHGGALEQAGGAFIGAVLLWDILVHGQIGFSTSFLEEMWSRNLGNLMMTPLRPAEFIAALMVMSVIRVLIGMMPVTLMAVAFFGFNFWALGLAVPVFFFNLILTSWAIGLIASGMVLKKGLGAEGLAWSLTFLFLPLCCVYYPVSTLPDWLQWIALALPPTHVFEGLRTLLLERAFDSSAMTTALALNVLYFTLAAAAFSLLLRSARWNGSLMQTGE
ncbi:MAG TPA: ABC transporter permease [Xanthobacteraceae bacterium]|nr:ABC transporter permease [Xanthobacteraceae bacterium]